MELEKKIRDRFAALLVLGFILYIVLNYWNSIQIVLIKGYNLLFSFILGGCIAFILNIPVTFISKQLSDYKGNGIGKIIKKYSTGISIVISCLSIIVIILFISSIIIPNIIDTIKILPKTFDSSVVTFKKWLGSNNWLANNVLILADNIGTIEESIFSYAKSFILNGSSSILLSVLGVATTFANAAVEFILGFIFAIYILVQKKKLCIQFKKLLYAFIKKERVESILEVLKLTSLTFSNFITGQCIVSAILGLLFLIVMMLLNLPYATVISIIIAFLSIIPVLGSAIGCAIGTLLIVMVNPIKAGIFIVVFIVIKQVEDNFIYPKVVGNSIGLPSIWVLAAITLGSKVLGVAGMIIFIPLFSVTYVLLRNEVYIRLKKKGMKIE